MSKKTTFLCIFILLCSTLLIPLLVTGQGTFVPARTPPPRTVEYRGIVTINGSPASDGANVTLFGNNGTLLMDTAVVKFGIGFYDHLEISWDDPDTYVNDTNCTINPPPPNGTCKVCTPGTCDEGISFDDTSNELITFKVDGIPVDEPVFVTENISQEGILKVQDLFIGNATTPPSPPPPTPTPPPGGGGGGGGVSGCVDECTLHELRCIDRTSYEQCVLFQGCNQWILFNTSEGWICRGGELMRLEAPPEVCTPSWICQDWSVCDENNQQHITCIDTNRCTPDFIKIVEARSCPFIKAVIEEPIKIIKRLPLELLLLLLLLVIIGLVIFIRHHLHYYTNRMLYLCGLRKRVVKVQPPVIKKGEVELDNSLEHLPGKYLDVEMLRTVKEFEHIGKRRPSKKRIINKISKELLRKKKRERKK